MKRGQTTCPLFKESQPWKDDWGMEKGNVFLVGAGPGDTGLITVKGLEAIKRADVILYDRLANPKLLEKAPSTCELIYCGKLPDRHTLRQEHINELLVKHALEGKTVVRLKGGDPGVFGRVGEEAEALSNYDISFDIIPGISSGIAAPLYAGIPVTHREFGESFAVVTAHDKSMEGQPKLDWKSLASGIDTIAFYMGIANLPYISKNLIKHGKNPETPVILIQWGTFGRQKTLEGTLQTIAQKANQENFSNPAITLVGDIVNLRKKINWYEKKPLFGQQILLARTSSGESQLAKEMTEQGADVYEFPKWIQTKAPTDYTILRQLSSYQQILFTSPESVHEFFQQLVTEKIDIRTLKADLFGASSKSMMALQEKGFHAEHASSLKSIPLTLVVGNQPNLDTLYPEADFYITSFKELDTQYLPIFKRMIEDADLSKIIFPSSQSVAPFLREIKEIDASLLDKLDVFCIGKQTCQTAYELGLHPVGMPLLPTRSSLIKYITNY
jgi:uroporphyrinogen III methyltransferase / synthase